MTKNAAAPSMPSREKPDEVAWNSDVALGKTGKLEVVNVSLVS